MTHPGGRPTLYQDKFCELVLLAGKEGKSVAEVCGEWEISKQTFYDWQKAHPEFLDACTRARDFSQAWWETHGRTNLFTDKFNTTLWIKNMHNRFRDDWYESSKQESESKVTAHVTLSSADKAIAEIDSALKK